MKTEKPVKFLQVFETTKHQVKAQAIENDMSIREYVQELADTYKDDTMAKIDNDVMDQLKEQAALTLWSESEFLRVLLDLYKSQASHKRD